MNFQRVLKYRGGGGGGSNVSKHCFAFRTNFSYSANACSIVFEKLKMKAELVKVWWKGGWQGEERTCVHEVEKEKSRKSVKVTTIRNEWEGKKKEETCNERDRLKWGKIVVCNLWQRYRSSSSHSFIVYVGG